MRSLQLLVAIAGWAAVLELAAEAQEPPRQPGAVVVGRVTDTLGAPLAYCFVRLEDARSATLCDSLGGFRLAGLSHAAITLEVRRLGYTPGRFTVAAISDSIRFTIQLVPLATVLRPISVAAPAASPVTPWLVEHGFYERMRAGVTGMFITPEELERLRPQRVTQVLQDRPGLKITHSGGLGSELIPLVWGRNNCLLNVFVDGIEVSGIYTIQQGTRRGGVSFAGSPGFRSEGASGSGAMGGSFTGLGIDAFVEPHTIAAMEIYPSGPNTPIEFRTDNECGAIVIWTKVGTRPAPEDSSRIHPLPADSSAPE